MPANTNFIIAGIASDGFGNSISGVAVVVSDDTLGERLTDQTDSNGEFSVNLADLNSQWADGNGISVIATRANYSDFSRTYTLVATDGGDDDPGTNLNSEQNIFMAKEETPINYIDDSKMSFGEAMSKIKRAFWKGVEEYTLTAAFVNRRGVDEFLEIPQGHTAYITQLLTGADDATDDYHVKFMKNAGEAADGAAVQVGREISFNAGTNGNIKFKEPIRVTYNSSNARAVQLSIKGGGTASKVSISFKGFILKEND